MNRYAGLLMMKVPGEMFFTRSCIARYLIDSGVVCPKVGPDGRETALNSMT